MKATLMRLLLLATVLVVSQANAGWDPDRVAKARAAVAEFRKADPKLDVFFTKAWGYVVFPDVGKGGMGIGGAYGKGILFERGRPVGQASLTQLTIGFQFGGQVYREIIFFRDRKALEDFKSGNFELGAQASAVAATLGASADVGFDNGIAVFTLAKGGLMYEASVGGQKFSFTPLR
ncbi:MAG TPA: hypothetical protein ENJ79_10745 [Gammaproteobacteria bacterium]|nr:hypothetical protein [Gammaproteobacteria bacterium]